jgi:hypothetical protein
VILPDNNFPGIIGEEQEWYPLQRLNSVPRRLLEIHTTPPHWHPALISAHEPILEVTIPGVAESFKTLIVKMTHGTDFKLINLLHVDNANRTHENLNTSIDEPEKRCYIHLVSYDILTSRAKPSSNGRLTHCSWSFGVLMSGIGMRRKIVWAGESRLIREMDSNFKSQQHRDSIHSMSGVIRRCGSFQVHLKIQGMAL